MGMVMINCPETGSAIPTGIRTDRESFRRSPVFFARSWCQLCNDTHEWFARDAWVHEPVPASGESRRAEDLCSDAA